MAAATLLVLASVEAAAWAFFALRRDDFTFYDPAAYVVDDDELQKLRVIYDRELGWTKPFPTPFGERPRERDYGAPLLATFGDSYTYCDDVGDDETWQTYFSRATGRDAFNFGTNGFGTDQAFLRYRREYSRVGTPLVTLGLTTDNIKRVVNVYRKFFYPKTGIPATKPRFVLRAGELVLVDNPIRSVEELSRLQDADFLQRIGRNDLWFNRNDYPALSFPRTKILFHRSFWLEARHGKLGNRIDDIDPRPWVDLWDNPEARDLMFALFDAFVEDARRRGAEPIVMVLPKKGEARHLWQTGEAPKNVAAVVGFCERRGYPVFDGVAELVAEARSPAELLSFHRNHLTPAGNRAIARRFRGWLAARGLLSLRPAADEGPE